MATPRKIEWVSPQGKPKLAWQIDYKDQAGKRRKRQFPRQKDALEWLKKYASSADALPSDAITMADAAQTWLDACERGRQGREPVEPHTHRQYDSHVRLHIVPRLGARKLYELTAPMIQEFIDGLLDSGMSRPMVKKVLTSVKSILNEAMACGKVNRNVALPLRIVMGKRQRAKIEIPTRDEAKRLLQALDQLATQSNLQYAKAWRRYRVLIITIVFTGMRASEIRGLAWSAVDLNDGTLRVVQRASEKNMLGSPKSRAGERAIHLSKRLVRLLREWRMECPPGHHKLVFPNHKGNIENLANIQQRGWKPLQERAEVVDENGKAKYTLHALRHFRASILIAEGSTPKEVMMEIGHSSIQVTFDMYGHLFPEDATHRKARAEKIADELFAR